MTEKRFKWVERIEDNIVEEFVIDDSTNKELDEEDMCELLNELAEEKEYYQIKSGKCEEELLQLRRDNEQLKNNVYDWKASAEDYLKLGKSLKKENEQLKQFKEDVFNKIDMHLRMLPTARDNEFNEDDGDPSLYTGAIYMLETLKKELRE